MFALGRNNPEAAGSRYVQISLLINLHAVECVFTLSRRHVEKDFSVRQSAIEVNSDGTLSNGKIFFDMTSAEGEDALDGMKIDQKGNLYVSGPGGLWIISAEGKHLGTIVGPEHPHNFAWGDDDGKTLYLCAKTGLYRIRLNIPGIRP